MKFLSENTLIPISTAVVVIGSCAMWMTRISLSQEKYEQSMKISEERSAYYITAIQEIRERLIRIETKLEKVRVRP